MKTPIPCELHGPVAYDCILVWRLVDPSNVHGIMCMHMYNVMYVGD